MPIGVVTLADPINEVNLILNYILTMPCVVVSSCTPVSSLQNAKNWPYPAVDCLDTPMSIIMPIKLSAVQHNINIIALQVKGSQLVIRGTILSIVVTKWLKALSARVATIEITSYYSTWPKEVQK